MATIDRLSHLLERFRVRTHLVHSGPLCATTTYDARPGRGFLHVLRHGELEVSHVAPGGRVVRRTVDRPSLVFYPRPLEHSFRSVTTEGADLTCATVDVENGATHPLLRTLPPVLALPLDDVPSLGPVLDLLLAEVDDVRCGRRIVADRLFEVVLVQLFRWILDRADDLALPPGLLPGLADERLAPTLVAVHERPGDPWTLETMARAAHLSRSAFAARFRDVVGQSPADYVTHWRLTVAQDRLRAGDPVNRTAADLGYATPAAFSRAFSRRLGVSPRAWSTGQRADGGGLPGSRAEDAQAAVTT
ncbi:AraC family transcriptional regulator [Cellulosimicrobium marinum]|uniref:AraC family transcriptional regulator n=1 Tax=Cellulosimicrobium marinum TaxID=1638992 RepID=UPI001E2AFC7B|nr:AraC family transcriptional regulator [Cellulosimicrobium marinum]MCB7135901.1 AraC family transcriptional regulator [Cellulosimicrobium marinum]